MRRMTSMTREEQIAAASYVYGMRGSSIDFAAGATWADANPKSPWISVEDDLPCNHEDMTAFTTAIGKCTYNVVVRFDYGGISLEYMYCSGYKRKWRWSEDNVTHWMRIPELPKE